MTPVRRTLLALLTIAVLVVAAGALYVRHWLVQPLALGAEPAIVEVLPGQTLTAVARDEDDRDRGAAARIDRRRRLDVP